MNGAIVTLMEGRQQYQGCSAVVGAMAVVAAAARQWQHNNQLKKGKNNRGSKSFPSFYVGTYIKSTIVLMYSVLR